MYNLLFTGASGFLGRNIKPILSNQYAIDTCGLSDTDTIQCNIACEIPNLGKQYEVVLHAAGKAHSVPKTAEEEKSFFDVNYEGTKHLCQALGYIGVPKALIFISTVAVYGCESGYNITEEHPLLGKTPYAKSKILAESFLQEWCRSHNVKLSIIRPSLIAGPNPPGNLGAMIQGIESGKYLSIANGEARKSVLMVQDIANLVPKLVEIGGVYNVCDSNQPSFKELEGVISKQLHKNKPYNIPNWFAKSMALVGDCLGNKAPINSYKLAKIVKSLTFSNEKAIRELDWTPLDVIDNFKIK